MFPFPKVQYLNYLTNISLITKLTYQDVVQPYCAESAVKPQLISQSIDVLVW